MSPIGVCVSTAVFCALVAPVVHPSHGFPNFRCAERAAFVDDQFLIAPRESAQFLFTAEQLPCPIDNGDVQQAIHEQCGNTCFVCAMAECFLHVHMVREAKRSGVWPGMRFGPIAVEWDDRNIEKYTRMTAGEGEHV